MPGRLRPHRPAPGRPVPTGTYRLQIQPAFTFAQAAEQVDYLAALGVSHAYLSPVLQPAPGSTHGYDVVDHSRLNEEAGGRDGFEVLVERVRHHGLGMVVDVVPNHMAVPTPAWLNRQWWSVLREGRDSPFAHWFDVDWEAEAGQVLLPVLGSPLEEVLTAGEIAVDPAGGPHGEESVLRYHDHQFPVRPGTEDLALPELLGRQAYRLAHWREGGAALNYRRFFDVTTLAALRVEDPEVFDASHALLLDLVRRGEVDGLRIDHPDGLADPRGYHARLAEATGGAWVVAEKILEGHEALPDDWPCAGTTGYDMLLRVGGVFADPAGEPGLTALALDATGAAEPLGEVIAQTKALVVHEIQAAEVNRLMRLLARIVPRHDQGSLRRALEALLASMDRYRAYVDPDEPAPREAVAVVDGAVERAHALLPQADHASLGVLRDLVLGQSEAAGDPEAVRELIVRFQQTCGPIMAKAIEDTAFYRYVRLTGLNEVGGDPSRVGIAPSELHEFAQRQLASWPTAMTTLSTHDTKRSEDVRARLAVLSELPGEWAHWLTEARRLAAPHRDRRLDGTTEYLLWQTLVGAWPISAERLHLYATKAIREAKVHTTWTDPDEAYEAAVHGFVDGVLADSAVAAHLERWVDRTAAAARAVVLGQKLLQLTVPGVPDVYQGTELVDLSLVDPDNRRPVDYAARRRRLDALDAGQVPRDLGDEKLLAVSRALRLRRDRPEWFTGEDSTYAEVATGSQHALAVARGTGERPEVVAVVTRLAAGLEAGGGFGEATLRLPEGRWRDLLGTHGAAVEGTVLLADLLAPLPVALLVRDDEP